MKPFADIVRDWQPFYSALATACATLTGLLFVALSINGEALRRKENAELMTIAQLTFSEFLIVMVISLVFLVPHQAPVGLAFPLLLLGTMWTASVVVGLRRRLRKHGSSESQRMVLRWFGLVLLGSLGVIAIGIAVALNYTNALFWLVLPLTALLASATRYAWVLLVQVRKTDGAQQ